MELLKMKLDLQNYKIVYSASQNISSEEKEEDVAYFDPVEN